MYTYKPRTSAEIKADIASIYGVYRRAMAQHIRKEAGDLTHAIKDTEAAYRERAEKAGLIAVVAFLNGGHA